VVGLDEMLVVDLVELEVLEVLLELVELVLDRVVLELFD
jgi:hypothetical protein